MKQVSSTDLLVALGVIAAVGAAVAKAIDKIMDLVKKKYEIEKLRLEVEEKETGIEVAKLLKAREASTEEEHLKKASEEIIALHEGTDQGRKNELAILLNNSLRFMLVQVQRGVIFEVSASQKTSDGTRVEDAAGKEGPEALEARRLA